MTGATPSGIRYPDANTVASKLGDELRMMALDIEAALKAGGKGGIVDTGWITLTGFSNGFSGRPGAVPRYRQIGSVVYLGGHLYNATAPTGGVVAFVLPAPSRPWQTLIATTVVSWGCQVQIGSDGQVMLTANLARTSGVGYPLDGISFAINN